MSDNNEAINGLSFAEPAWAKDIPEGEFISHFPSYRAGAYLDLFEDFVFPCDTVGDITYYVYDPIKNGAPADGVYPVLFFFHGSGNSLEGKIAVNYSIAELYASEAYQKTIGGAYLVVPMANERRNKKGWVDNGWGEPYVEPIMDLKRQFMAAHAGNVGKTFYFGTSAGGFFVWGLLRTHSDEMDVAIPIAGGMLPTDEEMDRIRENGTLIFAMHGRHDELVSFEKEVVPHLEKLESLDNVTTYFPEWVKNGDGGIAQMNPGVEMGQHCLNNQVTSNLMFDDGTPYDSELLPEGMTGWIRDHK